MKDDDFFSKVKEVVKQIPFGKVSTYGCIAEYLGLKSSARMVGWALNSFANDTTVPCHRVVNRLGELTGSRHFATPRMMRELLESEDVVFIKDAVDLKKHLWEPNKQIE